MEILKLYLFIFTLCIFMIPIINLLLLYFLKSEYKSYILKFINLLIFILIPFIFYKDFKSMLFMFLCDFISILILFLSEKLYIDFLNKTLSIMISQLTETEVLSKIFIAKKIFLL